MGRETVTVQNVELVKVIEEREPYAGQGRCSGKQGRTRSYPVCSKGSGQIDVLQERRTVRNGKSNRC